MRIMSHLTLERHIIYIPENPPNLEQEEGYNMHHAHYRLDHDSALVCMRVHLDCAYVKLYLPLSMEMVVVFPAPLCPSKAVI